jgi:hypothetical protein
MSIENGSGVIKYCLDFGLRPRGTNCGSHQRDIEAHRRTDAEASNVRLLRPGRDPLSARQTLSRSAIIF